jgi:hypothetical protein
LIVFVRRLKILQKYEKILIKVKENKRKQKKNLKGKKEKKNKKKNEKNPTEKARAVKPLD